MQLIYKNLARHHQVIGRGVLQSLYQEIHEPFVPRNDSPSAQV